MNYSYIDRWKYWENRMNIFFDVDGTLISMLDSSPRPMMPFMFKQQAEKYKHKLFLWSCAGPAHCKEVAARIGISEYISGYFEKPPYDCLESLAAVGITITPDFCYDDDPSDVVSYYGGLVVAPYIYPNSADEEYIAMNHFLGAYSRRFKANKMIMNTCDYRLDRTSIKWIGDDNEK